MALISFAKLICVFVFAYAKKRFSHDAAQLMIIIQSKKICGLRQVTLSYHQSKIFIKFSGTKIFMIILTEICKIISC